MSPERFESVTNAIESVPDVEEYFDFNDLTAFEYFIDQYAFIVCKEVTEMRDLLDVTDILDYYNVESTTSEFANTGRHYNIQGGYAWDSLNTEDGRRDFDNVVQSFLRFISTDEQPIIDELYPGVHTDNGDINMSYQIYDLSVTEEMSRNIDNFITAIVNYMYDSLNNTTESCDLQPPTESNFNEINCSLISSDTAINNEVSASVCSFIPADVSVNSMASGATTTSTSDSSRAPLMIGTSSMENSPLISNSALISAASAEPQQFSEPPSASTSQGNSQVLSAAKKVRYHEPTTGCGIYTRFTAFKEVYSDFLEVHQSSMNQWRMVQQQIKLADSNNSFKRLYDWSTATEEKKRPKKKKTSILTNAGANSTPSTSAVKKIAVGLSSASPDKDAESESQRRRGRPKKENPN